MQATFVCDHCGDVHPLEERYMVGEDQLCPDCASESTPSCVMNAAAYLLDR